jgi:hypothetical protein
MASRLTGFVSIWTASGGALAGAELSASLTVAAVSAPAKTRVEAASARLLREKRVNWRRWFITASLSHTRLSGIFPQDYSFVRIGRAASLGMQAGGFLLFRGRPEERVLMLRNGCFRRNRSQIFVYK